MPTPRSGFPTWYDVVLTLMKLGEREPTLAHFREAGGERAWHFAVAARGPDVPARQNPGPSPWLMLTRDERAVDVLALLSLFMSNGTLRAVRLADLRAEAARDPKLQRRARLGAKLAAHFAAHYDDLDWVRAWLGALDPRPMDDDDFDESAVLFGDRPKSTRRHSTRSPQVADPECPVVERPAGSSRPVLWRPTKR